MIEKSILKNHICRTWYSYTMRVVLTADISRHFQLEAFRTAQITSDYRLFRPGRKKGNLDVIINCNGKPRQTTHVSSKRKWTLNRKKKTT